MKFDGKGIRQTPSGAVEVYLPQRISVAWALLLAFVCLGLAWRIRHAGVSTHLDIVLVLVAVGLVVGARVNCWQRLLILEEDALVFDECLRSDPHASAGLGVRIDVDLWTYARSRWWIPPEFRYDRIADFRMEDGEMVVTSRAGPEYRIPLFGMGFAQRDVLRRLLLERIEAMEAGADQAATEPAP